MVVFPASGNASSGVAQFPDSLSTLNEADVETGSDSPVYGPARELREQFPVTRKELDATLAALDAKGLAFQNRVFDWTASALLVGPKSIAPILMSGTWDASAVAMTGVIWKLNDGTGDFGSTQLIAGTLAIVLSCGVQFFSQTMATLELNRSGLDNETYVVSPLLQLVRWYQLARGKLAQPMITTVLTATPDSSEEGVVSVKRKETDKALIVAADGNDPSAFSSKLLEHVASDKDCPCLQCLKHLPKEIFWERMVRSLGLQIYTTISFALFAWTTMVHFSASFWSHWYGVLLGCIFLGTLVLYQSVMAVWTWNLVGSHSIKLTSRIYIRATSIALRGHS